MPSHVIRLPDDADDGGLPLWPDRLGMNGPPRAEWAAETR
jgi:hypothetical protein